uniref:Uncharacterized protein n=1 Tax=Anguilla anguilla TaxID=7936 RepID=A0A0E9VM39_ANGAN
MVYGLQVLPIPVFRDLLFNILSIENQAFLEDVRQCWSDLCCDVEWNCDGSLR